MIPAILWYNACIAGMELAMESRKYKFLISLEMSDGTFIVSDDWIYDYRLGDFLKECIDDYEQTIKKQSEITEAANHDDTIYK